MPLKETIRAFKEVVEGKHDSLPEKQAFYMVGGIEEVVEKAKADGWIIMAKTFNFEIITPVRVVYNGVVQGITADGTEEGSFGVLADHAPTDYRIEDRYYNG